MSGISQQCTSPAVWRLLRHPGTPGAKAPQEQRADHLRRDIVAMVRVVVRHAAPKFATIVKNDDSFCPVKTPMMKDLADLIVRLDQLKSEHGLKGSD